MVWPSRNCQTICREVIQLCSPHYRLWNTTYQDWGMNLLDKKLVGVRVLLEEYKQPAFWSFRTKPSKSSTSKYNVGNNSPLIDRSYHTFQVPSSYNGPPLPPELWLQVLEQLQRGDLLTLTRVASQFRNMALSFLWQTVSLHLKRVTAMPMPCAPHLYGFIRHLTITMSDTLSFELIEPILTRIVTEDLLPTLRSFTWACRFRLALSIYLHLRNSPTLRSLSIQHGVLRIWELGEEAPPTCALEHLEVHEPKLITDMFQSDSHTLSTIQSLSFPHSGVLAAIEATMPLPTLRKLHFPGAISTKQAHRLLQFLLANPTIEELRFCGYCPRLPLPSTLIRVLPNLTTIIDKRDNAHIVPSLLWHQPLRTFASNTKVPPSDLRRLNVTNLRLLRITLDDAAFLTLLEVLSSAVEPLLLDKIEVHVKGASASTEVRSLRFI